MAEISLDKSGKGSGSGRARPARPDIPRIPTVRTIDYAGVALGVMVVALWVRVLGLTGNTDTLVAYLTKANKNADNPVKDYATKVMDDVHNLRVGNLISAIVLSGVTLLIVFLMRRTRTASSSRWVLLIVLILTSTPFYVIPIKGFPQVAQVGGVVAGVAAVAAIVLVFLPQSTLYFRQCREALVPPELRGQPRPSLGSLFRPKAARQGAGATGARPATRTSASSAQSSAKAKAKVRSDADAVAKGAELARARAKSSKSRRSV